MARPKKGKEHIAPEILKQLLAYDPDTGALTWKERPLKMFETGKNPSRHHKRWNTQFAGKPALSYVSKGGYKVGAIFNNDLYAHRVIWALCHDEWPQDHIDHINGDKLDNRICNLRVVTKQENACNMKRHKANTSGYTGVAWSTAANKWRAYITHEGKRVSLGVYVDIEEAAKARKAAEVKYGFHPNHGRLVNA